MGRETTTMAVVTMKQLLEAGVHFGHQTRRWDPRMKRFIHGERSGIYIIDLQQTLEQIESAYTFVRDLVAGGGRVLFVGTKRQAQDAIRSYAEKCGMPYVNQRWLGGMLTNFQTISKRIAKMSEYQRMRDSGEFEAMPKKEALLLSRELEKLERNLGGIQHMERLPDAIFVLDTVREHISVTEANKLGIPVVAVVDTDCNPDVIQHLIPGNDDAIRSGRLLCRVIADAVEEGRFIVNSRGGKDDGPTLDGEEKAAAQDQARNEAAAAGAEREARVAAAVELPDDEVSADQPIPSEEPDDEAPVLTSGEPDVAAPDDQPSGADAPAAEAIGNESDPEEEKG
jgi:small subunit ribosomal protein S2